MSRIIIEAELEPNAGEASAWGFAGPLVFGPERRLQVVISRRDAKGRQGAE